ncbi:MAG TPA: class II fumarate hydratase [Candidatus Desulfobacillus sp.]|nr:class II fumarate hydratase [Candidatus Desulfobacillus sp.]
MTRREHDSLGFVEVPDEHLWGAQTQRAYENFRISSERMPQELILALAEVKRAGAKVNGELGRLPAEVAQAIIGAADEVLAGRHEGEFPLAVWQSGSGTQTNMNMNEVLAHLAAARLGGRPVHPNDEVNLGQSSNDVIPTAMHVAATLGIGRRLLPALARLRGALADRSAAFAGIVKTGRTHLQDAVPLTLGQEFSGYVAQLDQAEEAVCNARPALARLAIGGTAVGTGLNTHPEFGARVAAELSARLGAPFSSAGNKFAALATHDPLVAAHGALKALAVALMKIANDIRWLASGPHAGLGELTLPANEPGSSIMPGKVNPTQCESLYMIGCQVLGNDVAIGFGGASGSFELNTCKPLIAHNFLQSVRLLADGMASFADRCVAGIEARRERIADGLARGLMLATALTPHIGYEKSAEIAQRAYRDNCTLKQAALALGYASAEDLDLWLRPESMLGGGA